jgi:hypothetical protein
MPSNIYRIVVKGHLFGTVSTRNMFTGSVSLSEGETITDLCGEYLSGMWTPLQPMLTPNTTWDTAAIENRSTEGEWVPQTEFALGWHGTASGDQIANFVAAVLIGKSSAFKSVGRKFFSGLGEGYVDGNSLTASGLIIMATVCAAYVSQASLTGGSTFTPGVLTKAGGFASFVSGFVSSLLGTVRRRKPGLGI